MKNKGRRHPLTGFTKGGIMIIEITALAVLTIEAFRVIQKTKNATKEAKQNAERAISSAYNKTHGYYAMRKDGEQKDIMKEHELAQAWDEAAILLKKFDSDLSNRLSAKSQFWRDGGAWSDEQIQLKNISLKDVKKDSNITLN